MQVLSTINALCVIVLNCLLPEFQQAGVLLVVPFHEGTVLLCLLPCSLLSQGACLLLILLP